VAARRLAVVLAVVLTASLGGSALALTPPRARAATATATAGCYRWSRVLRAGMSGADVAQLQIRVAGWAAYRSYVAVDGVFGPQTQAAVARLQSAYGLPADGVAGSGTYARLYALQDADCTPLHFAWSELDDSSACGGGFDGGRLPASTVQANVFRQMWKLEALRRKLGDHPLVITSGFRSLACNQRVGGASNSQHLYGMAADVVGGGGLSLCSIALAARSAGFSGILGPGAPDHGDHVHLDSRIENHSDGLTDGWYWSAPSCGIPAPATSMAPEAVRDV
jgi:zinc D-Ala-D-Ala carboxypeptidase